MEAFNTSIYLDYGHASRTTTSKKGEVQSSTNAIILDLAHRYRSTRLFSSCSSVSLTSAIPYTTRRNHCSSIRHASHRLGHLSPTKLAVKLNATITGARGRENVHESINFRKLPAHQSAPCLLKSTDLSWPALQSAASNLTCR